MTEITRRGLIAGAASIAGLAVVNACSDDDPESGSTRTQETGSGDGLVGGISDPEKAPFDTVVVLMMENRSFDHLLGWMDGVDGQQAGLEYPDLQGVMIPTTALGNDTQGCALKDPAHGWEAMATHFNGGKCDGWMQTQNTGDRFPIGYYEQAQVPIMAALADSYTLFDQYHCSILGATWPNRFYQLCAATDVDDTEIYPAPGAERPSKLETAIFDRLEAADLTGGYYTWGEPMTGLFESKKYDSITYPKDLFFAHAQAGTLPNVTFIDPDYTTISEFIGTSNDYHPHGDILAGEGYLRDVHDALVASPQWERMVFVLNFDENGGFYDHVAPPNVKDDNVNPNPGPHPDYSRLGFRVPAIAMGPFAPKKIVSDGPYEHCSVLSMIEWRWGLEPMSERDRNARNLAEALDFTTTRKPAQLPAFQAPDPPVACPNPQIALA